MVAHIDPVIRTSPRMSDLNMNGNVFGGWVLAQMDIAGGITASRRAKGPVATVAIEAMTFVRPIDVGNVISCYTEVEKVGRTSIRVNIDVMAQGKGMDEEIKVTEGCFIFVALDENGRPMDVPAED